MRSSTGNQNSGVATFLLRIWLLLFPILPANINSGFIVLLASMLLVQKYNLKVRLDSATILLLVYIGLNTVSLLYAANLGLGLKELTTWIMFLLVMVVSRKKNLFSSNLFSFLLIGIVIMNTFFLLDTLMGVNITMMKPPTFNCMAVINCLVIIIIENRILLGKAQSITIERLIQVLCILGIIISNVRGITAILAVYYIYHVIYKQKIIDRKLSRRMLSIFGILILVFTTLYILPRFWTNYASEMSSLFSGDVYSNKVRLLLYSNEINYVIRNYIWTGVGAGNFSQYYHEFSVIGFESSHSHSIFLQPFIELGIPGLINIALFFVVLYRKVIHLSKNSRLLFVELITVFVLYGMIDYTWVDLRVGIVFFIIVGQMLYTFDNEQKGGTVYGSS